MSVIASSSREIEGRYAQKLDGDRLLTIAVSDEGVIIDAYRDGGTTLVGTFCRDFDELFTHVLNNDPANLTKCAWCETMCPPSHDFCSDACADAHFDDWGV